MKFFKEIFILTYQLKLDNLKICWNSFKKKYFNQSIQTKMNIIFHITKLKRMLRRVRINSADITSNNNNSCANAAAGNVMDHAAVSIATMAEK